MPRTPLEEAQQQIAREQERRMGAQTRREGLPSDPWNLRSTMREGTIQGATRDVEVFPGVGDAGASVDVDREKTVSRDKLTPGIVYSVGTYTLVANVPLRIVLPRFARRIDIQNNSDLGGAQGYLALSLDSTPALFGDWTIRPGGVYSDDVFVKEIWLLSSTGMTINGGTLGGVAFTFRT